MFDTDSLLELQRKLSHYYGQRIKHHAQNLISIEEGKTGMMFFREIGCGAVVSGSLDVYEFAKRVDPLSDNTDFYAKMKATLTPADLQRTVNEMAFIERPTRGTKTLLYTAQNCSGFRNTKIVLLNSLPARKVKPWQLPRLGRALTARLEEKVRQETKRKKHIHAEMTLKMYLLGLSALHRTTSCSPTLGSAKKRAFFAATYST